MSEIKKTNVEVTVDIANQAKAMPEPSLLKMYIMFTLLFTFPRFNNNGETYDFEKTKEKTNTVSNGYINYRHDSTINLGSILSSEFVEEGEGGKIECTGVLWKDVLQNFSITPDEIKSGVYKVSMEVLYKDFYYYYDDELLDPMDNYHLEEHVGSQYEGKFVGRVIIPYEFSGCAITPVPADKDAEIQKAIAENYKQNKEVTDNMYKEFETKEDFENFKNSLAEEIKSELIEDEEVVSEIRNGYVSVAEVLDKFKDVELEADNVEGIVKSVSEIKDNLSAVDEEFKEFKKEVAEEKLLKKRVAELEKFGYELEDGEKEEIVNMTEDTFCMLKKTAKKAFEKAKAESTVDNENDDTVNPYSFNNIEDEDGLDTVKTFV